MVSADVTEGLAAPSPAPSRVATRVLLLLLLVAAPAFLALYAQTPPAPVAASAPPPDFSSARALKHVQAIAQRPRPMGSEAGEAARNYIVGELRAQGLDPQVQTALAVGSERSTQHRVGTVRNVVARLAGAGGGKAVLLAAHYDSVPTGPGANDDGVGVATLLETVRALKAGAPLRNDVIFLFTDGEEVGLLGARAFVGEHPWAKEVGVALNFEARGNTGPALMFETSNGNGQLIEEFAAAAPRPLATSLSYEIYKRMPNDTDLTVFKEGGVPGMNFAYIDGLANYHTGTDDLQSVSESSLQHQGSYALSLAKQFGGVSLSGGGTSNAVYFNLLGPLFIRYSGALVLPLAVLAALLYAALAFVGFRRGILRAKGVLLGAAALLVSGVVAYFLVTYVWRFARPMFRGFAPTPWGDPNSGGLYVVALALIAVAVFAAVCLWCLRRASAADLTAGALLWWVLLTPAVSLMMPGASYLMVWPLLSALAGAALLFGAGRGRPAWRWAGLALMAVPAVLLFSPVVSQVFSALTLNAGGVVAVLLVLLCGLLIPHLQMLAGAKSWALPAGALALGVALIVAGVLAAGSGGGGARLNSIFYGLNADTGQALWASDNGAPDEWTGQFFASGLERQRLPDFFPGRGPFLTGKAPAQALAAPEVSVLSDTREGDVRTIRLRVTSPRKAPVVSVYADEGGEVVRAAVNGRDVPTKRDAAGRPWALHYYALPEEGAELTLAVKAAGPFGVRVSDRSYGLPSDLPIKPRPAHMSPSPSPYGEATYVSKSFKL